MTGSTFPGFLLLLISGDVEELDGALADAADGLFKLAASPARPMGFATVAAADVDDLLSEADLLNGDGDTGTSFLSVFIFSLTNRRADSLPMLIAFSKAEEAVVAAGFVDTADDFDDFPAFFFIVLVHLEQYQIERGSEMSSFVAGGL